MSDKMEFKLTFKENEKDLYEWLISHSSKGGTTKDALKFYRDHQGQERKKIDLSGFE